MSFEEIEHTADRAFRVQGRNFAELLENAARAMSSLDRLGPSGTPSVVRTIEAEGIDRETLLVNWLNEILYLEQTLW
jgi:SHS2 domain-containing protein